MSESAFLSTIALFREFDRDEIEAVAAYFHDAAYATGATLLEEGAVNRGLHVVRSGRLQVSRHVGDAEVVLTELVEGESFGELSILEDDHASATLRAVVDTTVLTISLNKLVACGIQRESDCE